MDWLYTCHVPHLPFSIDGHRWTGTSRTWRSTPSQHRRFSHCSWRRTRAEIRRHVATAWFFLKKIVRLWVAVQRLRPRTSRCTRYFLHHIEGRLTTLWPDQKPLIHMFTLKAEKNTDWLVRHIAFLSQFIHTIKHIQGKQNIVPDALSCLKVAESTPA